MDCTAFLQWALPRTDLHWPGFRKVRRQVCKRLRQRMKDLQLDDFAAYQARLEADPAEWPFFDDCCHITISRFFRDRGVFEHLRRCVLPNMAARGKREGRDVRIWSAGCASGEEPYTLKILWDLEIANSYPDVSLSILATDIDETMLARARAACFEKTSLHELPPHLIQQAFERADDHFCIRSRHRDKVEFAHQDLRTEAPRSRFDLILCRYVAFTYFAPSLQQRVLTRMLERLLPGGYLVIGTHEHLPGAVPALTPLKGTSQIFRSGNHPDLEGHCGIPIHD